MYTVQDQAPRVASTAATVAAASTRPESPFPFLFDMGLPIFKRRVVFRNNIAPLGAGKEVWDMWMCEPLSIVVTALLASPRSCYHSH